MWLRDPLVIEVADNTSTPIGLEFWDEAANAPLDLTGYTLSCNVASADGQSRLANLPVEIAAPTIGVCDLVIPGSIFGAGRGERFFGGQIRATDGAGEGVTAARLIIVVTEGID